MAKYEVSVNVIGEIGMVGRPFERDEYVEFMDIGEYVHFYVDADNRHLAENVAIEKAKLLNSLGWNTDGISKLKRAVKLKNFKQNNG